MNVDNVTVLAKAQVTGNTSPVKPKPTLNMAIAFVVGLMISVGLAFLLEYLDNTIKSEEDLERLLELPVLGTITEIEVDTGKKKQRESAKDKVRSDRVEA